MPPITSPQIAEAIVKFVAAEAVPLFQANTVMLGLVNTDWSAALANGGDTVSIPVAPRIKSSNIAETGTVQPQSASFGSMSLRLTQHQEATFVLPDVVQALTNISIARTLIQSAMTELVEKIESDIFGNYPLLNGFNPYIGSAAAMTEALVDQAETSLFNARVPRSQQRYLVVTGDQYSNLRQIGRLSEGQIIGNDGNVIKKGELLNVKGFIVERSQLVPKPSTTSFNLAFTRDAIGFVSRALPLPTPGLGAVGTYVNLGGVIGRLIMSYNPNTLAQQFTLDVMYGTGPLRQQCVQVVQAN